MKCILFELIRRQKNIQFAQAIVSKITVVIHKDRRRMIDFDLSQCSLKQYIYIWEYLHRAASDKKKKQQQQNRWPSIDAN